MSFSDYKDIAQVQQDFRIRYEEADFIKRSQAALPEPFLKDLNFTLENLDVFSSEAARCELVILPILKEVYKKFASDFSLWVQKSIKYDEILNGTPDYLVSRRSALGKTVLEAPLVIVAEAKKNDFEQGWAQCLAELIAAQKLNGDAFQPVYGIVTDGRYWEFGNLVEHLFTKNKDGFPVEDLPELAGALEFVFEAVAGRTPRCSVIPRNPAS